MHADERGQTFTRLLMEEVYRHDFKRNGRVTFGSNFMPWEKAQKCADIVKIAGYNYSENIMKNITESIRTGLYMVVRQLRPCRAEVYIIFH